MKGPVKFLSSIADSSSGPPFESQNGHRIGNYCHSVEVFDGIFASFSVVDGSEEILFFDNIHKHSYNSKFSTCQLPFEEILQILLCP